MVKEAFTATLEFAMLQLLIIHQPTIMRFDCVDVKLIEHNNVTNMTLSVNGNLECRKVNK